MKLIYKANNQIQVEEFDITETLKVNNLNGTCKLVKNLSYIKSRLASLGSRSIKYLMVLESYETYYTIMGGRNLLVIDKPFDRLNLQVSNIIVKTPKHDELIILKTRQNDEIIKNMCNKLIKNPISSSFELIWYNR